MDKKLRKPRKKQVNHGLQIGGKQHKLMRIWRNMITRCYDTNHRSYKWYGAKGITVCDEWLNDPYGLLNFKNWAYEVAPNIEELLAQDYTLDRRDSKGNYGPLNCRWLPRKDQNYNTDVEHYLVETPKGPMNGKQVRDIYGYPEGIDWNALKARIRNNWSFEDAVRVPKKGKR